MGQKHEKEAEGLRVSEECSGGAERAPELVIKEKCRRRAGMWGRKSDQWFIFYQPGRTDLPEPAEPQSSGLLLWDGFHPGPAGAESRPPNQQLWLVVVAFEPSRSVQQRFRRTLLPSTTSSGFTPARVAADTRRFQTLLTPMG